MDTLCKYDSNPAVGQCVKCESMVCQSCRREFYGDTLCKVCTVKMYAQGCSIVRYDKKNPGEV